MTLWDKLKAIFTGTPPAAPTPAAPAARSPGAPPPSPRVAAPAAKKSERTEDPYDGGDVANASMAQVKARGALLRTRTSWDWRTDVIPPRTDERTALIDRAMVLRGAADEGELQALHAIGDEHLRYADARAYVAHHGKLAADDAIAALRAERAKRKEQKRADAVVRRAAEQVAREHRKKNDIVFLGRGVSGLLAERQSDVARLDALGLPHWHTPADVAAALSLSVPQLRQLCFHAEASTIAHYAQFDVPKKSGGTRRLAAPLPRMKAAQHVVLERVLDKVVERAPLHAAVHGFVSGRSSVTNARPHTKQDVLLNVDLADFFPSIGFGRVRALYASFGFSGAVATVLALLCTESPRVSVDHEGKKLWVATAPRALPQGACTSPMLSSLVCRRLDKRLDGLAHKRGYTYTRYADDLTFSASGEAVRGVLGLLATLTLVVQSEGFSVHAKKTRVLRQSARQEVTGVVVNRVPHLARDEVRRLRAIVHEAEHKGLAAANREGRDNFPSWLRGKLSYLYMVDPVRGAALLERLDAIDAPR